MTMLIENWRRRQRLDEVKFILPHAPVIPITVNMGYPMPGWYDIVRRSQSHPFLLQFDPDPLYCTCSMGTWLTQVRCRAATHAGQTCQTGQTQITLTLACTHAPQAELSADQDAMRRNEDEAGILRSQKYIHSLVQSEIDDGIPSERIALAGFSQGGAMSIFSGLTATVKLAGIVAMSSYLVLSLRFADLVPKPEFNKNTPILMCHGDADPVRPLVSFPPPS